MLDDIALQGVHQAVDLAPADNMRVLPALRVADRAVEDSKHSKHTNIQINPQEPKQAPRLSVHLVARSNTTLTGAGMQALGHLRAQHA